MKKGVPKVMKDGVVPHIFPWLQNKQDNVKEELTNPRNKNEECLRITEPPSLVLVKVEDRNEYANDQPALPEIDFRDDYVKTEDDEYASDGIYEDLVTSIAYEDESDVKDPLLPGQLLNQNVRQKECDVSDVDLKFHNLSHLTSPDQEESIFKNNSKHFMCNVCGKIFMRKPNLKNHLLTHNDASRTFKCKICQLAFKWKTSLNKHVFLHSGVKNHKCFDCGKSFAVNKSLKRHMLTHSNICVFNCSKCGKPFKRKDALGMHMLRHENVKAFKCKCCSRSFHRKWELERHMLAIDKRQKQCSVCKKTFEWKKDMLFHICNKS